MSIADFDFRSVWLNLSLINRLFFLCFCGVSIYTLSVCLYVLFHLHSLKKQTANKNATAPSLLVTVNRRLANLRQLHLFALYLFGFCIMVSIPSAFVTLGASKTVPVGSYIQGITFLFYFDAPFFLGFSLLHFLQWVASVRVDSFARQRN